MYIIRLLKVNVQPEPCNVQQVANEKDIQSKTVYIARVDNRVCDSKNIVIEWCFE